VALRPGSRLGAFEVVSLLGEGGMGQVYRATDTRLKRDVALKILPDAFATDQDRVARFQREAELLATLNHPNIASIYGIAEADGMLALVLELVEGVTLADHLAQGSIPVDNALRIASQITEALCAAHEKGIVHRDLKPSNIKVTADGRVKVLDFGLATVVADSETAAHDQTVAVVTKPGMIVGTDAYMSPEQVRGQPPDRRTDIWALGVLLYEMATGRKPFVASTVPELFSVILRDVPARLPSNIPAGLGAVIEQCLAKDPAHRYQHAGDVRAALEATRARADAPAIAHAPRALIVLPFYQLRPDSESDFLCLSLPDAISGSLAGLRSLVVRSSRVGSGYRDASLDLKGIATEADVNAVVTGTLLRAGDRIRISAQLLEVPSGAVRFTYTEHVSFDDIFQVQDALATRIVESLSLPLTDNERSLMHRDVPRSAQAYEFYLRGNQLSSRLADMTLARDFYVKSLESDSNYAPAWARLARSYRILAKYGHEPVQNMTLAQEAFDRAFDLNPDLPAAHSLYAQHEAEHGRATAAIVRLLERIQQNRNDAELYAALTYACRYAGLFDKSVAAHEAARRIDRNVRTTVMNTYFLMGRFDLALEASAGDVPYVEAMALDALGRRQDALIFLRRRADADLPPLIRRVMEMLISFMEGKKEQAVEYVRKLNEHGVDPEGFFYRARLMARLDETSEALNALQRAVRGGFWCVGALLEDASLVPVRETASFRNLLSEAETHRASAAAAFLAGRGDQLLAAGKSSTAQPSKTTRPR
jgi:serine/threonine protein kinase